MNAIAPPFPTSPNVGEWFGNWVWNGQRWVCTQSSGTRILMSVFTASGPYMPAPGLQTVIVECIGGGGGGGGAVGTATATVTGWLLGGSGGGSGGYSRSSLAAALVLGGVNMTVGAGGAAGTITPYANGGNGGVTSFGALVVGNGGEGGTTVQVGVSGANLGGLGGAPGIGNAATWGNPGMTGTGLIFDPGTYISGGGIHGGNGGVGWFGGGSQGGYTFLGAASNGSAGHDGGGGGGGASGVVTSPALGGAGGGGLIVITEYCWGDVGDDCLNPPIRVDARVAVSKVPWPGPGPCPPGWPGDYND